MAVYPTDKGSPGTWGAECSAYHAVSTDLATGKINNEALQAASTAPIADAALANKKYVDDGGSRNINGSPVVVHTKYFTGVTTAGETFTVEHGISSAMTKIIHASGGLETDAGGLIGVYDYRDSESAAISFTFNYDVTLLKFINRGTDFDGAGNQYWFKVDYID